MAPRRWLLLFVSLASLVLLAYAGVSVAFSVPVTPDAERASRLPEHDSPAHGQRALTVPLTDPARVPTFRQGGEGSLGYAGTLLVVSSGGAPGFPASASAPRFVRALAYVTPTASGAYAEENVTLVDVPVLGENGTRLVNLTLDVAALAGGRSGFLVKADAEAEAWFAPTKDVVGQVARFERSLDVWLLAGTGAFGFAAPLVLLVLTHRPTGRPGVALRAAEGRPAGGVCLECRQPLRADDADFCTRCGAWLPDTEKAHHA